MVAINFRTRSHEAEAVATEMVAAGGRAFTNQADLENAAEIDALWDAWDETATQLAGDNRLDVLINNAGITSAVPLTEIFEDAVDRILAVNTKAPLFMSAAGAKRMRQGGRIVTIGVRAQQSSRASSTAPMACPRARCSR